MNTDQLLESLRHFGVRYHEYPGWRTRSRGNLDAHVIMVHDSVTGAMSDTRAANFCIAGRSDVPGPLYNCLVGRDGTAHLIAFGKSNNAGRGDESRFKQAWRGEMPLDRELGRPASNLYTAANAYCHGISLITYGAGPYTDEQVEAGTRVVAAYCRAEGWSVNGGPTSVMGHGEFSNRKVDPLLDMGMFRTRVKAHMEGSNQLHHVVVAGETLWGLARRYSTTVAALRSLNSLTGDVLGVGWRLRVR